jgi:hypothetical protein
MHVVDGAAATLTDYSLRHTAAAGYVRFLKSTGAWAAQLQYQRASSAMHIYSKGLVTLDKCQITDEGGQQARKSSRDTTWWWIVVDGGTLYLLDSQFVGSATF